MYVQDLLKLVEHRLAGELAAASSIIFHMDAVIDDINTQLSARFPTISEEIARNQGINNPDYQHIPDKYLRSVVVLGAAVKFYQTDEEGNMSASTFEMEYKQNLFFMQRDFSLSIPERYQDFDQGILPISDRKLWGPGMRPREDNPFDSGEGFR